MKREELCRILRDSLLHKYRNEQYDGRTVSDVEVEIGEFSFDNENLGGYCDEISIRLKTLSPKRKTAKWIHLPLI